MNVALSVVITWLLAGTALAVWLRTGSLAGLRRSSLLLQETGAIVFSVDRESRITFANNEAIKFFGSDGLERRDLESLCMPMGAVGLISAGRAAVVNGTQESLEFTVGTNPGRRFDAIVSPLRPSTGAAASGSPEVIGAVFDLHEIADGRGNEVPVDDPPFHDHLTGLANRALFRDRAGHALDRKARDGLASQYVCVLFIDLDGFGVLNDDLGHEAGDALIQETARRLKSVLRPGDTVARLGGDEFAVLLEDPQPNLADQMAERILAAIQTPVLLSGCDVQLGASIGLAEAGDRSSVAELLRNADTAMAAAKDQGKNRIERFRQTMFTEAMGRLELAGDLRHAASSGQLHLVYQPIVRLDTRRVVGAEALLRWRHPGRGEIPAAVTVALAEETGMMVEIGQWILRTALAHLRTLPSGARLRVSVNVSAQQIEDPDFVDAVETELRYSVLEPSRLVLELPESSLSGHPQETIDRLIRLQNLGVGIAVDGAGSRWATRDPWGRMRPSQLKIAVGEVGADSPGGRGDGYAIMRDLVAACSENACGVVAKGVEDESQVDMLRLTGCGFGQGHLFSPPLSLTRLFSLLAPGAAEKPATDND